MNKSTILSILAVIFMAGYVSANNDVIKKDGNGVSGSAGVVELSTGTNGVDEIRNIHVDNRGNIFTRSIPYSVKGSSFITVESTTFTEPTDGITASTYTVANSTSRLPNPNVYAVAWPSSPVVVKWEVGAVTSPVRVRLFDSRGSTQTAGLCLFDGNVTTGTVSNEYVCSSGVVLMVGPVMRDNAAAGFVPGRALPSGDTVGPKPYIRLYTYEERKQDFGKTP